MKKFAIILLMGGVLLSGCNYLDIVPDERNTPENTYQNPQAAKNYLNSNRQCNSVEFIVS